MAANSLKIILPCLQSMKVPQQHILITKMKAKKIFCALHEIIGTTRLYAAAFGSVTPLLQLDHFKSHGYGPVPYALTL